MDKIEVTVEELNQFRRFHFDMDEDCWYSCPKSGHCCNDTKPKDECDCGADAWNAKLDALLARAVPSGRTAP